MYDSPSSDSFKAVLQKADLASLAAAFAELQQINHYRIERGKNTRHCGRLRAIHRKLWPLQIEAGVEPTTHPDNIFPMLGVVPRRRASRWNTLELEQWKVFQESERRMSLWVLDEPIYECDVNQAYAFIPEGEYQHALGLQQQVEDRFAPIRTWFKARGNFYKHDESGWEHAIQLADPVDVNSLDGFNAWYPDLGAFEQKLPSMSLIEVVKVNAKMISYRDPKDINTLCRGDKKRFYPCTEEEWADLSDQIKEAQLYASAFNWFMRSTPSYEKLRQYPVLLGATQSPLPLGPGAFDDAILGVSSWSSRYEIADSKIRITSGQYAGQDAEVVDAVGLGRYRRIVATLVADGSLISVWNSSATLEEGCRQYNEMAGRGVDAGQRRLIEIAINPCLV